MNISQYLGNYIYSSMIDINTTKDQIQQQNIIDTVGFKFFRVL